MKLASIPSGALLILVLTPFFFMGWLDDQKDPPKPAKTTKIERLHLACGEYGFIDKNGDFKCTDKNGRATSFAYDERKPK